MLLKRKDPLAAFHSLDFTKVENSPGYVSAVFKPVQKSSHTLLQNKSQHELKFPSLHLLTGPRLTGAGSGPRSGSGGSLAAKSFLTLCNPIDCSPSGSSVHGDSPARILEWVTMPSSRGSSQPRIKPRPPTL